MSIDEMLRFSVPSPTHLPCLGRADPLPAESLLDELPAVKLPRWDGQRTVSVPQPKVAQNALTFCLTVMKASICEYMFSSLLADIDGVDEGDG